MITTAAFQGVWFYPGGSAVTVGGVAVTVEAAAVIVT